MTYLVDKKLHRAIFIERQNRFICIVAYKDKMLRCHLPNPGRMVELLFSNTTVVYIELVDKMKNPSRTTDATVLALEHENEIINLDSNLVSKWLPHEFSNNSFPGLKGWKLKQTEIRIGNHRFDLLLEDKNGENVLTEVKSTTRIFMRNKTKIACFPDAVSLRASKQVRKLMEVKNNGKRCMIIFVVQRKSASFQPCYDIDPKFSATLEEAEIKGIELIAVLSEAKLNLIDRKTNDHYFQIKVKLRKLIPIKFSH